jgi:hypothetical protein
MLHLVGSADQFELYKRSRGRQRFYHQHSETPSSFLPSLPSLLAGPQIARALLTPLAEEGVVPTTQTLGWNLEVTLALDRHPVREANVGCLARGTGPAADTAVVFTAHYDHLGVSTPNEAGDSIYNGFSDNAAGVAMLLAIAAARNNHAFRYSRVFLFFSGEERGLLGSDYFVSNPDWPLERMRAVINLDAGAPPGRPVSWHLAGVDSTRLGAIARAVAETRGWEVATSPPRANSDYFPFAREGVPAVFIIPGRQPYEGTTENETRALVERWDRYHRAGDRWAMDFPFAGLGRYAGFALAIADALDDPMNNP